MKSAWEEALQLMSPCIAVIFYGRALFGVAIFKGSVGGPKYLKRQQKFSLTSQRKGFECAHSQSILILLNIQDIQNIKFSGSTILMEFQAPATMSTSQVR